MIGMRQKWCVPFPYEANDETVSQGCKFRPREGIRTVKQISPGELGMEKMITVQSSPKENRKHAGKHRAFLEQTIPYGSGNLKGDTVLQTLRNHITAAWCRADSVNMSLKLSAATAEQDRRCEGSYSVKRGFQRRPRTSWFRQQGENVLKLWSTAWT